MAARAALRVSSTRPGEPALLARLALLLLVAPLAGCIAHFPRADEPMEFMERTTIATSPGSEQLFEARPAIHVYFTNGLDDATVQERGGWAAATAFSFLAQVRMLDEPSTPVRTPSYEPRLTLQLFRLGRLREARGGVGRALGALELSAAHYSNGQKGCALADHLRGSGFSDFDCLPETDPPSTALNTVDGSFTTNYVRAGLLGKWIAFREAGGPATWTAGGGIGAEWHLPCSFAGCMDPPMLARHGEVVARWGLEADLLVVRAFRRQLPLRRTLAADARLRATVKGRVHLPASRDPFADLSAELAFVPRTVGGLGIGPFVRLHRGRDDLNIRFEERLDTWTFGFVIDPAPAESLDRGAAH